MFLGFYFERNVFVKYLWKVDNIKRENVEGRVYEGIKKRSWVSKIVFIF